MIKDFVDRHTALSTVLIVLFTSAVPGALTYCNTMLFGGTFPIARVIFALVFILDVIIWLTVERPILAVLPFLVGLFGVVACEMFYIMVSGLKMGWAARWPGELVSLGVAVFGPVITAAACALMAYVAISAVRAIIGK